jgi:hypothetical protein
VLIEFFIFLKNSSNPKMSNFCSISRKAIILTVDIHVVFRGLKFEPDTEIGQKEPFMDGN